MKNKNIYRFLNINKQAIIYIFILNILLLIPAVLSPIFRQVFTDYILIDGIFDWLFPLLLLMMGSAFMSAFITWMQKSCLLRLSNKIEILGASRYIWMLIRSPLSFFQQNDSYQLLSKLETPQVLSELIIIDFLGFLFNIISVIFYIVMMLRINVIMTLVVIGLVVLIFLMSKVQSYISQKLIDDDEEASDSFELILRDNRISSNGLKNIETFKSTASETHFFQRLIGSKTAIVNAQKSSDLESAYEPLGTIPEVLFLNLLLLICSLMIMNRNFTIGSYLAFQAYASSFFSPLTEAFSSGDLFEELEDSLNVYYAKAEHSRDTFSHENVHSKDKLDGYIDFKDVSFSYEDGTVALENISFSIEPGQRVAILGRSGAGKTTLMKLLQGIYEPSSGEITIDGIRPSQIEKQLFANSIGCANQNISLFRASIRDNITMWDYSVSDAEIYNAANDACIHKYTASLDGAYDYQLSEDGKNLSGGQRQRIEIARALLYNPSIVLFDEATSSIDPINRSAIEENLVKRACTCLAVTHITSLITDYDEIIVLDKGKIVAKGSHDELMKSSEYYVSIFQAECAIL